MAQLHDVTYTVKCAILREKFDKESGDKHDQFGKGIKETIEVVATKRCDLLDLCRESVQDSKISEHRLNLIREGAAELKQVPRNVSEIYT